jgi:hypothetical protein
MQTARAENMTTKIMAMINMAPECSRRDDLLLDLIFLPPSGKSPE